MKKTNVLRVLALIVIAVAVTGCADVENVSDCLSDNSYGFWGGLWHGCIAPISFIGSLFSDNIAVYAVNNTGKLYDFGFVLGAGILLGRFRGGSKKK